MLGIAWSRYDAETIHNAGRRSFTYCIRSGGCSGRFRLVAVLVYLNCNNCGNIFVLRMNLDSVNGDNAVAVISTVSLAARNHDNIL